jgi:hypothetical protein
MRRAGILAVHHLVEIFRIGDIGRSQLLFILHLLIGAQFIIEKWKNKVDSFGNLVKYCKFICEFSQALNNRLKMYLAAPKLIKQT